MLINKLVFKVKIPPTEMKVCISLNVCLTINVIFNANISEVLPFLVRDIIFCAQDAQDEETIEGDM